jgi:CCR4-NOT transcription complex subunit 2
MTDKERYGLPGFLVTIDPLHPDYNPLAMGQDLTQIGLDLSRPDSSPLYPTFATPFADPTARPIVPEFELPTSYKVNNVPPLMSKIANFSDDTLFAIFYQFPRDVLQELAAQELFSRDWRFHTQLRQWMQKDTRYGPPTHINARQERGYYVFFDAMTWSRNTREFLLHYEHLDQRYSQVAGNA